MKSHENPISWKIMKKSISCCQSHMVNPSIMPSLDGWSAGPWLDPASLRSRSPPTLDLLRWFQTRRTSQRTNGPLGPTERCKAKGNCDWSIKITWSTAGLRALLDDRFMMVYNISLYQSVQYITWFTFKFQLLSLVMLIICQAWVVFL